MYFIQLSEYSPVNGLNTDKQGLFPFLSSNEGLFEPTKNFEYHSGFPFTPIETTGGNIFYISEPNLVKLFRGQAEKSEILIDHATPITPEYANELKQIFYEGYSSGLENFHHEIGPSFISLSVSDKRQVLESFMDYCQRDLYFEGFAIPRLIANLGYIQACLVTAFKEYHNLNYLKIDTDEKDMPSSPNQVRSTNEVSIDNKKAVISKIPIKYPVKEIRALWQILLDIAQSRSLNLTPVFNSESKIEELLGSMFTDVSGHEKGLPNSSQHIYELPLDYQPILYLLMHATYKLNYIYTRLPLEEYSKLLKETFSVFHTIELNNMPGNFTKKHPQAIAAIRELKDSSLAKNALKILAKIPSYRIQI